MITNMILIIIEAVIRFILKEGKSENLHIANVTFNHKGVGMYFKDR